MQKRKKIIIICSIIFSLISIIVGAFFIYVENYYHGDDFSYKALKSDDNVIVEDNDSYYSFIPKNQEYKNAIIFYQGAKVEVEAYSPLLKELASNNIACYAIKCSFNLALFNVGSYKTIYDLVKKDNVSYYAMGHSLGGVMAGIAAKKYEANCKGIILLASYLSSDISKTNLSCLSIYGTNDGILKLDKYEEGKRFLPDDFTECKIDGGIHSYFASYGLQKGDGIPQVSKEFQLEKTVEYIKEFLS